MSWTGTLAVVALGVLGFCAAFTHVWDSDVPWHLACGEWMLRHHQVMGHDYFSINPEKVWINVHWLFQVIVAAIYRVAGYDGLSWLKGLVCAGGMITFALALRRHVPIGWLIFCGLLMLYVFQGRIRVRPELFTLSLLIAVTLLVDSVRRGASPIRMWLMVPITLFWVNMHGLFIVGMVIMWGMIIGAFGDCLWGKLTMFLQRRYSPPPATTDNLEPGVPPLPKPKPIHRPFWTRLICWHGVNLHGNLLSPMVLAAALAASAACFMTPWPLEVVTQPVVLSTRISGGVYSQIVTELKPLVEVAKVEPQKDDAGNITSYKPKTKFADEGDPYITIPLVGYRIYNLSLQYHTEGVLLFLLALAALIFNARRVPVAHVVLLLILGYLSLTARRNVGLMAPLAGVLLALHGGTLLNFTRAWKPTLARIGKPFAALMAVATLLVSAGYATGMIAKWHGHGPMWGSGRQELAQADKAAQWLGQLPVDGDVLTENFGDGGIFIYYSNNGADEPRRLSYMDGRLEAHTYERFLDIDRIRVKLGDTTTADCDKPPNKKAGQEYDLRHDYSAPLPPIVRFIFVNDGTCSILTSLMQTRRFELRYIEPGGVVFENTDWQRPDNARYPDTLLGEPNFSDYDRTLNDHGLLDNHHVFTTTWYRRYVPDIDSQMGYMLTWLGTQGNHASANTANDNQKQCSLLAIRYLNAAWTQGLGDRQRINSHMARAYHWRSWQSYVGPSDVLPVDLRSARAMRLFADVTVSALGDETNNHRGQWTLAMEHAGQMDTYFKLLDNWVTLDPNNKELQKTAQASAAALKDLKTAAANDGVYNLPPLARAYVLSGYKYRLTEEAITTLQERIAQVEGVPGVHKADMRRELSQLNMLLGDLMLRKGLILEARRAYQQAELPPEEAWQMQLRVALVDWVGGARMASSASTPFAPIGFNAAVSRMRDLAREHGDRPIIRYYLAEMLEDLGYYDQVKELRSQPDVIAFARAATERSQDMMISPVTAFSKR